MSSLEITLIFIGFAFLMFGIGFNWRNRRWGVTLITIAVVCMLSTVAYKIYLTFY